MMSADEQFLDRLCDRAAQAVKSQHLRCETAARGAEVWTALTLYHNAGHKYMHLRTSLFTLIRVYLR